MKIIIKRYLILIISLLISSIYFNLFQLPNKIITGGSAGVSIIINYYFGLEPSQIIMMISILLLIIGTFVFGLNKISGALIASIIYPFFIKITENIQTYIPLSISNMITISIIVGILSGLTTSMVYRVGFSNGGFAIISELVSKFFKISIGKSSFIVNILIVLLGGISIGIKMVIYSTLILIIHSIIVEKLVKGNSINNQKIIHKKL